MVGDNAGILITVCGGNLAEEYNLANAKNDEVVAVELLGAMLRRAIADLETANKADIIIQ